jgi:hypothetical protein
VNKSSPSRSPSKNFWDVIFLQGAALHLPGKLLKKVSPDPSKPFINFFAKFVAVLFCSNGQQCPYGAPAPKE